MFMNFHVKQLATRTGLQVSLGETKSLSTVAQLCRLMSQLALWTTKDFQDIQRRFLTMSSIGLLDNTTEFLGKLLNKAL